MEMIDDVNREEYKILRNGLGIEVTIDSNRV